MCCGVYSEACTLDLVLLFCGHEAMHGPLVWGVDLRWSTLIYLCTLQRHWCELVPLVSLWFFMSFPTWCQENCHLLSFPLKSCSSVHAQVVLMLPQEPEKLYTLHSGRSTTILVLTVLPGERCVKQSYSSSIYFSSASFTVCPKRLLRSSTWIIIVA